MKRNLLATEMKKSQKTINKPVYLGLPILDPTEYGRTVIMHELWYDYIKPKHDENAKICYMDADSFIVHVKTDICKDISKDVKKNLIFQIMK